MLTRRDLLRFAAAAPAAALNAQQPLSSPNILFILADDLGYGDLGCYGQQRIQTPNIDKLAASGIRFTQTYAGATVCAPSRCCLMTGKHTGHATIRGNKKPEVGLMHDEPTVASLLKRAGYTNALFGKWGLGGPGTGSVPNTRGFDQFFGYLDQQHAHNSFPEHLWENQNEYFLTENWFNRRKTFSNDLFTKRSVDFLAKHDAAKPFFLYLAYTVPHADNERGAMEKMGIDVPDFGPYANADWPDVEKAFASSITRMDSDIARVLKTLDDRGMTDNTLVIFSSDNGPHHEGNHDPNFFASSGAVRGTKRDLYEGGIRVPAIASWRGSIKPEQTSNTPWAFWDFLPTACSLAGATPPRGIDGVDLRPALFDNKPVTRDYFYWEFHEGGFAQAVRQGDWKLVRQRPKMKLELFDLSRDPKELNDVSAQHPDVAARLSALFKTARTENPNFPTSS
jgi:arylsulfatase A-like enzyme